MNQYTLRQFYKLALTELSRNIRKETAKDKIRRVELHILPHLGGVRLTDLTPLKIEKWQNDLQIIRGANQVRRCKLILKNIMNRAIVHGIIRDNPMNAVMTIREPRIDNREIYTKEEIKLMLDNSFGITRLFIFSMVSLALRSGEVIGLKWSNINWNSRTIYIQRTIRKGEIKAPKSDSRRYVNIPLALFVELTEYREQHKNDTFIFTHSKGDNYSDSAHFLRRHFKPLLERLGIEYRSLYSLRHTSATLQRQGGQSLEYVSHMLGHKSTTTTQAYYIKYIEDSSDLGRIDNILCF
jgi:integrase